MKTDEINNDHDIIDSRDIIARIQELESDKEDLLAEQVEQGCSEDAETTQELIDDIDAELTPLKNLEAEAKDSPDWEHGEQLIRYSYFKEYAMELADDIGAIPENASWPANCIDWDQAARELMIDYTPVDFDGITYYIRS